MARVTITLEDEDSLFGEAPSIRIEVRSDPPEHPDSEPCDCTFAQRLAASCVEAITVCAQHVTFLTGDHRHDNN